MLNRENLAGDLARKAHDLIQANPKADLENQLGNLHRQAEGEEQDQIGWLIESWALQRNLTAAKDIPPDLPIKGKLYRVGPSS